MIDPQIIDVLEYLIYMDEKREVEKVELSPPIDYFLNLLTQTKPYFPEYLSRQLCE